LEKSSFYETLKIYCSANNAKLLVLTVENPATNFQNDYGTIDKLIQNETFIFEDIQLNNNLFISNIKLGARQIDPLTGLNRIGSREGSFIFGSPKQRMKPVPTGDGQIPRCLMTTGCITLPAYIHDNYMSKRTAYIANADHIMGAIIVEIEDECMFHFRQIQAAEDGSFEDLLHSYSVDEIKDSDVEAIVLGDIHVLELNETVDKVSEDIINELQPKRIFLHDVFNGYSISHHEKNDIITRALKTQESGLSLSREFTEVANYLNKKAELVEEIIIVKSNHDEFLNRYLKECRYKDDPENHYLALYLAISAMDGEDVIKVGCEMHGLTAKNIKFLKRDESYKICGIECGNHGDKGSNGSRGNASHMDIACGNSISGHSHTPEILRGAYVVGTSTDLRLSYNTGFSSWINTHCVVYKNGQRQLINIICGKWKT
jgi:hypothetical protein